MLRERGDVLFQRSLIISLALSCFFLLISALVSRWDWFWGFLWGAIISLFHFQLLYHSVTRWLQHPGVKVKGGLVREFLLRLLIAGLLIGLGILYLPLNFLALALGLFLAQASLLIKIMLGSLKPEKG
jgi:hypothetical protein